MNDQARILPDLQQDIANAQTLERMLRDRRDGKLEQQDELTRLRAENARLKAAAQSKLSVRLAAKGGISVYGLGRWPVTLYRSQWERLLSDETAAQIVELYPQAKDKAD